MPADPLATFLRRLRRPLPRDPLGRRDPEAIAAALDLLGPLYDAWFAAEVTGLEQVPPGPVLVVGSHNGGNMAPDMFALMIAAWRHFGPGYPTYGLAHDQVFAFPGVGRVISLLGGVPARHEHGGPLLASGATVLVYPGGDLDAFRPYRDRHRIRFGGRTGFIRLALRQGVPIVPVVSVGAHETIRVLTDGRDLARRLGLKRLLRVEVLPLMLCLPWGLSVGPFEAHLPLPSKIRIRALPAMRFPFAREAADDPAVVAELAARVEGTMQRALDDLARGAAYGVRARLAELRR